MQTPAQHIRDHLIAVEYATVGDLERYLLEQAQNVDRSNVTYVTRRTIDGMFKAHSIVWDGECFSLPE